VEKSGRFAFVSLLLIRRRAMLQLLGKDVWIGIPSPGVCLIATVAILAQGKHQDCGESPPFSFFKTAVCKVYDYVGDFDYMFGRT
jgi:hypothetical protein